MSRFDQPRSLASSSAGGMLSQLADDPSPWTTTTTSNDDSFDPTPPTINSIKPRPTTWASNSPNSALDGTSTSKLPQIYDAAWEMVSKNGHEIERSQLEQLLKRSGLDDDVIQEIIGSTSPSSQLNRTDFNLALILVSQAETQQALNLTLAKSLLSNPSSTTPIPNLSLQPQSQPSNYSTLPRSRAIKNSESSITDPWGNSTHNPNNSPQSQPTQFSKPKSGSNGLPTSSSTMISSSTFYPQDPHTSPNKISEEFSFPSTSSNSSSTTLQTSHLNPSLTLTLSTQQQGSIPFFKHNTYTLISHKRNSKVLNRRYSDFVFLHEVLLKRYPFRLVPTLPPKRIGINLNLGGLDDYLPGALTNSLSTSVTGENDLLKNQKLFNEQRRKGLIRYLEILENHEVLKKDAFLKVFFTEKSLLSEWRISQAEIQPNPILSEIEESLLESAILSPEDKMLIPQDFDEKFRRFSFCVDGVSEKFKGVVDSLMKIAEGVEKLGGEFRRLGFGLRGLEEVEGKGEGWGRDEVEVDNWNKKIGGLSEGLGGVWEVRGGRLEGNTLEGLKYQLDLLQSFQSLISRHQKLSTDSIESLRKRIDLTQRRLTQLSNTSNTISDPESHRLLQGIESDRKQISILLNRREHIKTIILKEMDWIKIKCRGVDEVWKGFIDDEREIKGMVERVF